MEINRENRLYEDLKKLRLNLARDFSIPAWKIFNDKQLEKLIELNPKTIEDLLKGNTLHQENKKKIAKYILTIFKLYFDDFDRNEDFTNKVDLLFEKMHISEKPSYFDEEKHDVKYISLAREIKNGSEFSRTGFFYSEKMTRNIYFESELERQFYLRLEKKADIKYYLPQPLKIKYMVEYSINDSKYSKIKSYYPDILVIFNDNTECLVEIKNYYHLINLNSRIKLALCEEIKKIRGIGYLFSTNYQHSLDEAIEFSYNEKFFNPFLNQIKNTGAIAELHLDRARVSAGIKRQELLPFCYKNGICLDEGEFKKYEINKIQLKGIEVTFSI